MKIVTCLTMMLAAVLAGCGNVGNVGDAKDAVKARLLDPQSANFDQVTEFDGGVVCGRVNAKNRMGGYIGFKVFLYKGMRKGEVDLDPADSDIEAWCRDINPITQLEMLEKMCKDAQSNPALAKERDKICKSRDSMKEMLPDL